MKKSFISIDEALEFEERMRTKGFVTTRGLAIEKFRPVVVVWICEEEGLKNPTNVRRA